MTQPLTSSIEVLLLIGTILVLVSILASRAFALLGVPALLIFLVIGMLAGSEGPGGIYFNDPSLARNIGVVALVLILFSGGLDTDWQSVRPVLWQGLGLATVGVILTALLVGLFIKAIAPLTLTENLLIGSIVSSTDAAAVFAVLRSRKVSLQGRLKPLLELESGSNDPMAVFLTVGLVGLIVKPSFSTALLVPMFMLQMTLGTLIGYLMGRVMVYTVNRIRLEYEGLYPVLTLALVLLAYSGTSLIGGNGFLAVYICGIVMGNHEFIHKKSLLQFHDGLAWLMQIMMFLTLGLLVFPSRLLGVIGVGIVVSAFLMLVARPISVFSTLAFAHISLREKTFVSWVGLRGAVPIILATFPLIAGIHQADMIFDLIFFIVLTSVLLQGTSIPALARWLKVDIPMPSEPEEAAPEGCLICKLREVRVFEGSSVEGKQIVEAGIPEGVEVLLLGSGEQILTPSGSTILQPDDLLLIAADEAGLSQLETLLQPAADD